jgi:cytochrome c biogenesis protein ResB
MIARIKKDYNFKEVPKNKDAFINVLDTSLLSGDWDDEKVKGMNKPLFTLGTATYTQADLQLISAHINRKKQNTTPKQVGYTLYNQFVDESWSQLRRKSAGS